MTNLWTKILTKMGCAMLNFTHIVIQRASFIWVGEESEV